jgi:hypothetical protein
MILVTVSTARLIASASIGQRWLEAGTILSLPDEEACDLIANRRMEPAQQLTPQQIGYINALTDSYFVRRTGKHPRFEDFATQA